MTNDPLEYALYEATNLMDELVTIKDRVGNLDDLYATEYIDNRINLGAYQNIAHALRKLQNYVWQRQEETKNG